jgi:hypothetical protein
VAPLQLRRKLPEGWLMLLGKFDDYALAYKKIGLSLF